MVHMQQKKTLLVWQWCMLCEIHRVQYWLSSIIPFSHSLCCHNSATKGCVDHEHETCKVVLCFSLQPYKNATGYKERCPQL